MHSCSPLRLFFFSMRLSGNDGKGNGTVLLRALALVFTWLQRKRTDVTADPRYYGGFNHPDCGAAWLTSYGESWVWINVILYESCLQTHCINMGLGSYPSIVMGFLICLIRLNGCSKGKLLNKSWMFSTGKSEKAQFNGLFMCCWHSQTTDQALSMNELQRCS